MIGLRGAILMKADPAVSLHANRLFSGRVCSCKKDSCHQGHYFYKERMKNYISGGGPDLFLSGITREQKIVAMNGFRCLLPLILIFS